MNQDLPPSFNIINLDLRQNKWIYEYTDGHIVVDITPVWFWYIIHSNSVETGKQTPTVCVFKH